MHQKGRNFFSEYIFFCWEANKLFFIPFAFLPQNLFYKENIQMIKSKFCNVNYNINYLKDTMKVRYFKFKDNKIISKDGN